MKWKTRTKPHEQVEYEPLTVLELLTEMKDLSELTTDLAYSALILDSDPIGAEVEELARRMDVLKYKLRLQASLSVRTTEEAEQVAGILQIADASEHIANAASDLVGILDANVELRPFLGEVLDEADDRITTLRVPDSSPLAGRTLGEVLLESKTGLRVIAIRRLERWIYDPDGTSRPQVGDVLVVRGQQEGADHVRAWLHGEADL